MTLNCVVFNKNEIYCRKRSIKKLFSDFDLLSNLEDLHLNINQCSLILKKNYEI